MKLTIHTLTPERAADYIRFFDETPHNHGGEKCYCVTWRADEAYSDGCHWYPTEETRRAKAMAYVQNGGIEGYLAYDGERVIGWCNANGNCSLCVEYLRSFWNIAPHDPRVRVKSIFCFAVAPAYQHKGVATALLNRVCRDAAAAGYDCVEAYATNCDPDSAGSLAYHGPIAMYEKAGFVCCGTQGDKIVLRKTFNA